MIEPIPNHYFFVDMTGWKDLRLVNPNGPCIHWTGDVRVFDESWNELYPPYREVHYYLNGAADCENYTDHCRHPDHVHIRY